MHVLSDPAIWASFLTLTVMYVASGTVSDFISRQPNTEFLAGKKHTQITSR